MLRALWFLLKLSLLVGALAFALENPGRMEIEWQGYIIETSVAFAGFILLVFLFFWTQIYKLWRALVTAPAQYRQYRALQNREKGYAALTRGLVAIAAGDRASAEKFSVRAETLLPDLSLTRLLIAQTAQLKGDTAKARREFAALLDDDVAAFFGVRGLLNEALSAGDAAAALTLIRHADKIKPRQGWILKTLFELEAKNREWVKAEGTLHKAEKFGAFTKEEARCHRQAILTARADQYYAAGDFVRAYKTASKALDLDMTFIPAALRLLKSYQQAGKRYRALRTLAKVWTKTPHPDLADIWMSFMPPLQKSRSIYDDKKPVYDWARQLYDRNPEHRDSKRLLGEAALEARLWRDARQSLTAAGDFRLLAKLERAETNNEAKAREWLEQAADRLSEPKWVCTCCGHAALDWNALCRHCESFNTYLWMIPTLEGHQTPPPLMPTDGYILSPP